SEPVASSAQWCVAKVPALIHAAPARPETTTGVCDEVVLPLPSCPTPLLPKQAALPSSRRAHMLSEVSTASAIARLRPWAHGMGAPPGPAGRMHWTRLSEVTKQLRTPPAESAIGDAMLGTWTGVTTKPPGGVGTPSSWA